MVAATNGKSECLLALIQAKAGLNLQAKVRWSEAVASVSRCNIDYLGLESKSEPHQHYHRIGSLRFACCDVNPSASCPTVRYAHICVHVEG